MRNYDDSTLHAIVAAIHRTRDFGARKTDVTKVMLDKFVTMQGESNAKFGIGSIVAQTAESADLDRLLEILADKSDRKSRHGIVSAVTRLMKADAVPLLIGLLGDESDRLSAIENLGELRAAEAIPYIEPFTRDKDAYVRQFASRAIKQCKTRAKQRSRLPPPSTIDSVGDHPHEVSINIDLEELASCLRKLNRSLSLGLPALALVQLAQDLDDEQEQGFTFQVLGDGGKVDLHLRIYKDDVDSCSLFLFTPSRSLAASLEKQLAS